MGVENREPGVQYQKLANPKQLLLPASVAEVAFVGYAKTTKTIEDEEVTRGSGTSDALANATVSSLTSIYDINGVNYFQGTDYQLTTNQVDWSLGGNEPAAGVKYYVTYEIPKVDADYAVKVFYTLNDVLTEYGPANLTNQLSLAAQLFFNNGGSKLTLVQVNGTDQTAFLAAVDKLSVVELDVVIPLETNKTGFTTLFTEFKSRIFQLSQPSEGMERMGYICPVSTTTYEGIKTLARALKYERLVLTAPLTTYITIDGVSTSVPGYYFNAAMAGILADPDYTVAEPLTRKELVGFDNVGILYTKTQKRDLISYGVLVVEQKDTLIRIVQGITTDRTSLDKNEISLVRIGDFFGKTCRNVLDSVYIGTRLDATTLASIRTTLTTIVDNFIANRIIAQIASLSVTQNKLNPTAVDVSLRIQPVYPLNFITVEFTLELL